MKRILLFLGLIFGAFLLTMIAEYLSPAIQVTAAQPDTTARTVPRTGDDCPISPGYPDEVRQWCDLIVQHAAQNNLDPNLIAALIWQESGGNPQALSVDGAVGLMQVMPRDGQAASFQCPNGPCFADRPSMNELYDPAFNIEWGIAFLAQLQARKGSIRDALKAYGPANVDYYYADKVLAIYASY